MQPEVTTIESKRRFQIEKLEERIAPCGCNPCNRGCDGGTEIEVNLSLSIELGGCH
jgi:hypothetical protein